MNKRSRMSSLLLIVILLNALSTSVFAGTELKQPLEVTTRFVSTSLFNNNFAISSSGKAQAATYINTEDADKIVINGYLQQYKDGSWQTIKSWSKTEYAQINSWNKSWYVVKNHSYRYKVFGYVYRDSILVDNLYYISDEEVY
ncbi:hypothetical protein [Fusibacter ferrireducens]|uniref:Surface layer protein A domain-containing protein n=1 Tax=Fusibacter ferrireducens TaxID=2785058 RepID=A0ABR9ZNF8_9FIRM|nr:hypothetical protein [Fusibacter ferrireducens]MBF4692007.1 hypothetical protein [Fusibacter ferrireducens]